MSGPPNSPSSTTPPRIGRWAGWVRLLDRREAGTSLALFRIACGLVVLGAVGSVVVEGLVPVLWYDQAHGGILTTLETGWLFRLLGGVYPSTVWVVVAVTLAAGLSLVLGVCGRLSAFVALQSYQALIGLDVLIAGGDDTLLGNALWLLVLARSTATLSLECRLRTGRWVSDEQVPAWPRYLAIFQLVLVYFAAG